MRARDFVVEDNADYDEDRFLKSDPGTPLNFPKGTTLVNVSDVYDWYKLGMAVSDLDDADPRTFNRGVPHTVFAFGSEQEEHRMIPLLKRLGFSLHDIDSPEDYEKAIRASDVMEHLDEMAVNVDENMDHSKDGRAVEELRAALLARKDQLQSATDDEVYDIIDKIMTRIARSHSISGQKLHDMWVDEYKQIPDTWIMQENFADGKNPQDRGDSARHGIAKKSSLGSLDKIVRSKTASPRKKQLAHWQANMRRGRAKKS